MKIVAVSVLFLMAEGFLTLWCSTEFLFAGKPKPPKEPAGHVAIGAAVPSPMPVYPGVGLPHYTRGDGQ